MYEISSLTIEVEIGDENKGILPSPSPHPPLTLPPPAPSPSSMARLNVIRQVPK